MIIYDMKTKEYDTSNEKEYDICFVQRYNTRKNDVCIAIYKYNDGKMGEEGEVIYFSPKETAAIMEFYHHLLGRSGIFEDYYEYEVDSLPAKEEA